MLPIFAPLGNLREKQEKQPNYQRFFIRRSKGRSRDLGGRLKNNIYKV